MTPTLLLPSRGRSAYPSYKILASFVLVGVVASASAATCSSQNTGKDFDSAFSAFQSVGLCSKTCSKYAFGILQGKYCWCSNTAPGSTTSMDDCNDPCPGYPDDNCGNESKDLYAYIDLDVKPSSTAAATSTSTSSTTSSKSTSTSSSSSSTTTLVTSTSDSPITTTTATTTTTTTAAHTTSTDPSPSVTITEGITEPSQTGIGEGEGSGSNSASKSSGLAGGAIAGIVIGVVGGVALIIAALLWFFKRRRNDTLPSTDASPPVVTPSTGTSSMPFNAQYGIYDPIMKAGAVGTAGGFMDARMRNSSDIYDSADRRSNVSLRDDQDYSRPVLRLANPDPDN